MPYGSISELPSPVKAALPAGAQEIYKGAFNTAYAQYQDDAKASRIAWGAVKQSYKKEGGKWIKKSG